MYILPILAVVAGFFYTALSTPTQASNHLLEARGGTPSTTGPGWGYYNYWVNSGGGQATFNNGTSTPQFVVYWTGDVDIFGGKGWNPGTSTRIIRYDGNYNPGSTSSLSIYGWTRNPLVEYHIVESYAGVDPSTSAGAQLQGSVTCDGASYDVLKATRVNQPSIDGVQTFQQYWSVRNPPKPAGGRIAGNVTVVCHFVSWRDHGMNIGSAHNFQIVAVGAQNGTGSTAITFSG